MSLLDEAREESSASRPGSRCAVARLDDELRSEVEEALADESIPATAVERALAKRDVRIRSLTLRRHVRGDCSCDAR